MKTFVAVLLFILLLSGCRNRVAKISSSQKMGTIEALVTDSTASPIPKTLFTGDTITIPFSASGVKSPIVKIELEASFDGGQNYSVLTTSTNASDRSISWTAGTTGGTKSYFRVKFTDSTSAINYSNTFGPVGVYTRIDTITGVDFLNQNMDGVGEASKLTGPNIILKIGTYYYLGDGSTLKRIDASVSPISVTTIAGNALAGGNDDGIGRAARFQAVSGIAYDGNDYLYLSDSLANCIRRYKISTQEVDTYAGLCGTAGTTSGVTRLDARYSRPYEIRIYSGELYIADSVNNCIRKINLATGMDSVVAGSPGTSGSTDATGISARFTSPQGIDFDDQGNLFVADTSNGLIRWVNISTGQVKRIGMTNLRLSHTDGINGQANRPYRIIYYNNALYVTDLVTSTLRKIVYDKTNPVGTDNSNYPVFSTVAGIVGVPGEATGVLGVSKLGRPTGLAIDGSKILVLSANYRNIYSFDPATNTLSDFYHFHNQAIDGYMTPAAAKFFSPTGITNDGTNIYVSSTGGHAIQKIDLVQGRTTVFAGQPMSSGTNDGNISTAKFSNPAGILYAGGGFYIADYYSHLIRFIKNGTVITLAGTADASGNLDSASGSVSSFYNPYSLCVKDNDLYVAEYSGNKIRKLSFTDINNPNVNPTVTTLKNGGANISISAVGQIYCKTTGANQGIYIAERSTVRTITRVDFNGGPKVTIAGTGVAGSQDGNGAVATFTAPFGLAAIGDMLYVSDNGRSNIRRIDLSDPNFPVTTISSADSTQNVLAREGSLMASRYAGPMGLTALGNKLYMAENTNHTVREIDLASDKTSIFGTFVYDSSPSAIGLMGGLNRPLSYPSTYKSMFKRGDYLYAFTYGELFKINYKTHSVEKIIGARYERYNVDGNFSTARLGFVQNRGALSNDVYYFGDQYNHTLRKIDFNTQTVSTIAGTSGIEGNSSTAFNLPSTVVLQGNKLFVTEASGGKDIRLVDLITNQISVLTGQYGVAAYADGNSATASFDSPTGMTLFGSDLYVSDVTEHTLRKIDVSDVNNPIVSTVGGTFSPGAVDGNGTNASFNNPRFLDNDGVDIFVADTSGSTIRRFNPRTNQVSTIVGQDEKCTRIDGLLSVARICFPNQILRTDDGMFFVDGTGASIRWIH